MEARWKPLLLQARALAASATGDHQSALAYLEQAVAIDSTSAVEALYQQHLSRGDYRLARSALEAHGAGLEKKWQAVLHAVLDALEFGRRPSHETLAHLQPGHEALWPLLYQGVLEEASGKRTTARRTLLEYLRRMAWRQNGGRSLAVEILLRSETRRCRLCRVRKPYTLLQFGEPLCSVCNRLAESQRLDAFVTRQFVKQWNKHHAKHVAPLVPVQSAAALLNNLDEDARQVWKRARRIAEERGREVVGVGELGTALFEGPFDRQAFCDAREQERAFNEARSLPEEGSSNADSVSDELSWLLNVANWMKRLFKAAGAFPDKRRGPLEVLYLRCAYFVGRPGPFSLMGATFARMTSYSFVEEQAELFKELLAQRPDSFFLRIALSNYHRRYHPAGEEGIAHELWLIRQHPAAARTQEYWLSSNPAGHRACVEQWAAVLEDRIGDPDVLTQALQFFKWEYPGLARELNLLIPSMVPEHRRWLTDEIDHVDRLLKTSRSESQRRRLSKELLPKLEHGLQHPPVGHSRRELQANIANHAWTAQQYDTAHRAALRVLKGAGDDPDRSRVRHCADAHCVLGLLALREGNLKKAGEHLLDSLCAPPYEKPIGPFRQLTRLLWQMNSREVLRIYLARSRKMGRRPSLEPWLEEMQTLYPDFAPWLDQQPTCVRPQHWPD